MGTISKNVNNASQRSRICTLRLFGVYWKYINQLIAVVNSNSLLVADTVSHGSIGPVRKDNDEEIRIYQKEYSNSKRLSNDYNEVISCFLGISYFQRWIPARITFEELNGTSQLVDGLDQITNGINLT
jgi:hypothetical protein